jgi:hypothetical protein
VRRAALLIAVAVLGAGCTGDRPSADVASSPRADPHGGGPPRCQASPGSPPDGFVLRRAREIRYTDHVGVREEYRHGDGRLLVFLLGITGEMGEGATVVEELELSTGGPATLFGDGDNLSWSLIWSDDPPCPQMAIVGNGFSRDDFVSALRESGVLPDSS